MHNKKLLVPFVLIFLSSCYTTCIQPLNCPKANDPKVLTTYSYLWGAIPDPRLRNTTCTDCGGVGFSRVTVVNNFGHILCSIVTLGIVVPTQIRYDCATPPQPLQPTSLPHAQSNSSGAAATGQVPKPIRQKKASPCGKPTRRQNEHDPCK